MSMGLFRWTNIKNRNRILIHQNAKHVRTFSRILFICLATLMINCSKDDDNQVVPKDPLEGSWYLIEVNDIDVSTLDCYQDSYIQFDGTEITFYLSELNVNGTCDEVLNSTSVLTNEEGFYYIGNEAIEFYVEDNMLTWRVDQDNTLIFENRL